MLSKFFLTSGLLVTSLSVNASLNVFTCQPDWASLVKQHAPNAEVFSATTAMQDPHYIQARPSLISKMRKADLVVCSGAELEIGWLPELQRQSRNRNVQNGKDGLFWVTDYVKMLDTHDHVDRSMGDVHSHGNPHVQFAVADIPNVSKALVERLAKIDPENRALYKGEGVKFRANWRKHMSRWQKQGEALKGMQLVGYHETHRYLFAWLGIKQIADLEPKPGLPPTVAHLNSLSSISSDDAAGIVYSSHQPTDASDWLSQRTGLPVAELAQSVGGRANTDTLATLVDDSIVQLLSLQRQ
ncbi:metal ABC transporter solute-binding protein, Zn/Mn family [Vibrio nigripulchritudo]|uniref:metal ABC transporter solute-binding protein, Zn/Mn family n=1 Tax=Vibrio nigripulchritudo TaxID=28173 RepID=UPI002491FB1F|nr:zinc ABC transporter substrate-binding protein [Vibrio nigripulchritudo]BDU38181.1 zinc ABC transporter substrate-binding protein [Vibrio nigripulchritudo]BDU43904.1 zinc ABC transporter substrate-binding protein [Vibrio nigripulchritudo]